MTGIGLCGQQDSLKAALKQPQMFFKYFLYKILIARFHSIFVGILCFKVAVSSEDVHRGCHLNLRGQDNLKTQKMREIAIAIYLCNIDC